LNPLDFVRKNLQYLMVVSLVAGLSVCFFLGGIQVPKWVLVTIVIVLVIYPVMINTRFEEVFSHLKEPRPLFCSLAINFIFSPAVALGLGHLFLSSEPNLLFALMLLAMLPTSAMSAAWTAFSGAKMATALYLVPANLVFAAFVGLPFVLPLLMGQAVQVNRTAIIANILLVFFAPLVAGDLTRRLAVRLKGEKWLQTKLKPQLGGISAASILVLIFLVMSLERNAVLMERPGLALLIVAPVALYYLAMYVVSILLSHRLTRKGVLPADRSVVVIYTSVSRHINIALALALSAFPVAQSASMVLLLVVAFILQVPTMAFYAQRFGAKFVRRHSADQVDSAKN
jgi:ACR3 family arsenite efflux pump ArsB